MKKVSYSLVLGLLASSLLNSSAVLASSGHSDQDLNNNNNTRHTGHLQIQLDVTTDSTQDEMAQLRAQLAAANLKQELLEKENETLKSEKQQSIDQLGIVRKLYSQQLTDQSVSQILDYFVTEKSKGHNLREEAKTFVNAQINLGNSGYAKENIKNDKRLYIAGIAYDISIDDSLDTRSSVVRATFLLGHMFDAGNVDSSFNQLGYSDTWPWWNEYFGIKGGNRGLEAFKRAQKEYDPSQNDASNILKKGEKEVRRLRDKFFGQ